MRVCQPSWPTFQFVGKARVGFGLGVLLSAKLITFGVPAKDSTYNWRHLLIYFGNNYIPKTTSKPTESDSFEVSDCHEMLGGPCTSFGSFVSLTRIFINTSSQRSTPLSGYQTLRVHPDLTRENSFPIHIFFLNFLHKWNPIRY